MKEISTSLGYTALVDDEDYDSVSQHTWWTNVARRRDGTIRDTYALTWICGKSVLMHRFILGITDPKMQVDHRDHNGLNNCRSNIRVCSARQNRQNARVRCDSSTGYKNIFRDHVLGGYKVNISVPGRRPNLGTFPTLEEAIWVYNEAVRKYHGDFAVSAKDANEASYN